ncbi:MAG: NADH-quinone oxidoreductase subunit N [Bacteroidetes bacterium]|nr:NADH-quinone oxidoreductase subunit N [Bacteroidota bacterium]
MRLENFLIMRQELLLTLVALIVLIADLAIKDDKKRIVIPISIVLFFLVTVAGFIPASEGILFGGMYKSTALTILMKNILNVGVLIVFIQSVTWLKRDDLQNKISEYFILIVSTLIGMNFMISSGDFLMFYLGLETATIPIAALAAYEKFKAKSAEAGIKLILSSALSSGILLYGLSMIYGTTGSIYFADVAASFGNTPLHVLAFIFFFAGMAFKISLVPFHLWTADVYEGAPINVTSYLSVISKGAAVFIFTIILYTVFSQIAYLWRELLVIISLLTMTVGNLFAIRQQNLKRFLAFSSIAQAGFILLGILDGSVLGMTSTVYFVMIYIFSNLGAFGVVAAVSNMTNKENMDDYNGFYRTNPKLSLVMMLSLFSLAGIPPVAGFFGKFFLFTAAAHQGYYMLVLVAVLNATISLYYYLLLIKAMFINTSDNPIARINSDFSTKLGLIICVVGIFVIGFASPLYELIRSLSFGF